MIRCRWDNTIWDGAAWVPDPGRPRRAAGPYVASDLPAYKSPLGTGVVDGRAARREDLKRNNCREVDPGEFKPVFRDAKFCKQAGIEQTGDPLPPPKRLPTVIGPRSLGGQEPG